MEEQGTVPSSEIHLFFEAGHESRNVTSLTSRGPVFAKVLSAHTLSLSHDENLMETSKFCCPLSWPHLLGSFSQVSLVLFVFDSVDDARWHESVKKE